MNSNISPPRLGQQHPIWPPLLQLLRVTDATIPGPTGGASAGLGTGNTPPPVLYIASTQQLRTDTYAPRDREPCLVVPIPIDSVLSAGYYLGRLSSSFQTNPDVVGNRQYKNLPVYEVVMSSSGGGGTTTPTSGASSLPGLTLDQILMLSASLTPLQITDLNNLTACQLQVLLQLPVVNIQLLSNLNPTQLQNVVDGLTLTQLKPIAQQISIAQMLVVSSAYPQLYQDINQFLTPAQALATLTNLTAQQVSTLTGLTPTQLQVIAQLTVPQLQILTNLTQAQVTTLVGQLTLAQLSSLLTALTTPQLQQLTNNLTAVQTQTIVNTLTGTQIASLTVSQLTVLSSLTTAQIQLVGQLTNTQIQTLTSNLTGAQLQNVLLNITGAQLNTVLTNLTTTQLINLSKYPPPTVTALINSLTIPNLVTFLTLSTPPPSPILGTQTYFPNLPVIYGRPSSTPGPIPAGYAPVVVDGTTGKVWDYNNGIWITATNGDGGGAAGAAGDVQLSNGSGTFIVAPGTGKLNWNTSTGVLTLKDPTTGLILTIDGTGGSVGYVFNCSGGTILGASGGSIGFFGNLANTRITVNGSSTAAILASLMASLGNSLGYGLVKDSETPAGLASGSFTTVDLKTVTVVNGEITSIV